MGGATLDAGCRVLLFAHPIQDPAEARQAGFEVVDDLCGQFLGFGEVVEVGEALVLEPEDVEAGLVASGDLFVGVAAPAAVRCSGLVPGCGAFVAVLRVVALTKSARSSKRNGFFFRVWWMLVR